MLVVPTRVEAGASLHRWSFSTYGPLRVDSVGCARAPSCPTGPIRLVFATPVRGAELLEHVRIAPALSYTIADSSDISHVWTLDVELKPRQSYAVVVDSMLTDIFGQKLGAVSVKAFATTGFAPTVLYDFGKLLVERSGLRTLAAQVVNIDTLIYTTIAVPEAAEAKFLAQTWRWQEPFDELKSLAVEHRVPISAPADKPFVVAVPVPANDARASHNGTLIAVRMRASKARASEYDRIALVQVTDLAIHGKMALDGGLVWVTGVRDGKARPGATVTLYNADGKVLGSARTDAQGLARFAAVRTDAPAQDCGENCGSGFEGYIAAVLNDDRAVVGFSSYDPDLAAWRFDISSAWSTAARMPAAAAVFTERGIYRPGERVFAKAIVRTGTLGALSVPRGDSLKWTFNDRENGVLRDTVTALSSFGTADQSVTLSPDVPLGQYQVQLALKRAGEWHAMATTSYEVAEYRPPEFLVDVNADTKPRFAGDSLSASISARYLFGAPMANAQVRWIVQHRLLDGWELEIPNTESWQIGSFDLDESYEEPQTTVDQERIDTLDATGALDVRIALPTPAEARGARVGMLAVVTDANRQAVTAGQSVIVHPASFYLGARTSGTEYFWRAGHPVTVEVMAVRPDGPRVRGVTVQGAVIRREWHRVRRVRAGQVSDVGGWVSDTVATCRVVTNAEAAPCEFTPAQGGSYVVALSARDERGRLARTTLWRWAAGQGWMPWRDDSQLRMDIIPDKKSYTVGDTATLLVASPFTDVEAWVTIERERVLESRRMRIAAGATTIKVPITEALAPNAFVSVLLVRGRSATPGPLDDPGRPALRVGYAELRVTPEIKKLTVEVTPVQAEYRPGDDAQIRLHVQDVNGQPQRTEVTLWAVDEGVLALTGYQTPDPVSLLYQPRPLGVRLSSNLVAVAAQVPAGMKGQRAPGGSGGSDVAGVLRSRFQTTAFFLGSVLTDADGHATAAARLPDNLTTFRVMAVAVTAGDRYGAGKSALLVTRPLVARPSLPRFVREGDRFSAGVVVNQRIGGSQKVAVEAAARGIALNGAKKKSETLNGAAGREVRFDFTAQPGDSAHFQFSARGRSDLDAVAVTIPVRPNYHPLAQTVAGAVRDTARAVFTLEQAVDPARSRLEVSFGSSTLAIVRGARNVLRVYPYYCTEQVASNALPLIALYRAQRQYGDAAAAPATADADIRAAIRVITRRQRPDGGIGYWSSSDWSSPWLTAYATRVLLEARAAGFAVDSTVLNRIADYITRSLHQREPSRFALAAWYASQPVVYSDRVAAVDLLSRLGRPDIPMENTLLGAAAQLFWEDRVLLAEVFARRAATAPAQMLLASAWQAVRPSGRKLELPVSERFYFESTARPAARLLSATLAIDPSHAQLGQLVETLVDHGRGVRDVWWNTQDYGWTVLALLEYERRHTANLRGSIRISGAQGTLLTRTMDGTTARDTSFTLAGLINGNTVRLDLAAQTNGAPVYYYLTIREVPRDRPVRPVDHGISVERWYERVDNTHTPLVRVNAGDLVRVRLRVTVPSDRQFVVLDDPLPAGLEAIDLSLRTVQPPSTFGIPENRDSAPVSDAESEDAWYFGSWDSGIWSAFDHKELRDDRVVYAATFLWKGTYTATYLARATTPGTFIVPPAHAEEMYNPAVNGRTGGSEFTVILK
ncbi:MAG TPA: alpha-2-macroglobulin family protein [Longimicrobiales bacterium]